MKTISDSYTWPRHPAPTLLLIMYCGFFSFVIRVLPSVYAKMGGQLPSCATIELKSEGTWHKIYEHDRLENGKGHERL